MSGLHDAILNRVRDELERMLITEVPEGDPTRAGVVKLGNLDGEPDPDEARISITLHENDPDGFIGGMVTAQHEKWIDEVDHEELGGDYSAGTYRRRFTAKGRVLLDISREGLAEAREIASTVRTRLEHALLKISFSGIEVGGEYISRRVIASGLHGEMLQGGGPPDSYDFLIKVRFEVLSTKT